MKANLLLTVLSIFLISNECNASFVSFVNYSYSERCEDSDPEVARADLEEQCRKQNKFLIEVSVSHCEVSNIGDYITEYSIWYRGTCE